MTVEEALLLIDTVLDAERINNIEELVFRESWEGKTYTEIANSSGYNPDYIREIGANLWRSLSEALTEKITKHNFKVILRQQYQDLQQELRWKGRRSRS